MLLEKPRYINTGGKLLDLNIPRVMGILNITPDSFFKGSRYRTDKEILKAATQMLEDGADILDIGGYSSRPGAEDISVKEEGDRVLKAIKLVRKNLPDAIISVDTFRADIASEAIIEFGANMINDISGGDGDNNMFSVVSKLNVPYIIMHMKGDPGNMQDNPTYSDVIAEVIYFFEKQVAVARSTGIQGIIIDPGFGFGKTVEHNYRLLSGLETLQFLEVPVMVGISRKSMICKVLGTGPENALTGTSVLQTIALMKGALLLRTHDVKEAVEAVKLVETLKKHSHEQ